MVISMQVPILAEDVLAKVPMPVSVPVTDTFYTVRCRGICILELKIE